MADITKCHVIRREGAQPLPASPEPCLAANGALRAALGRPPAIAAARHTRRLAVRGADAR
jgi:hypothetical protein